MEDHGEIYSNETGEALITGFDVSQRARTGSGDFARSSSSDSDRRHGNHTLFFPRRHRQLE